MSTALYIKLFNQFKEITDAARSAVSRHILPLLEGVRVKGENDAHLLELYTEWQAMCRAATSALQHASYPNELLPMSKMPVDDEEHAPCRQMAAVIIERTVYDEHVAGKWFDAAAIAIKNNPNCANHSKSCACQLAIEGWAYDDNLETVNQLKAFYAEHYEKEKDEDYVAAIRDIALSRGITFEEEMPRWRRQREHNAALLAKEAAAKKNILDECVFICYQDFDNALSKHNNGKCMHGYFRVIKKASGYEFTIMDTGGMEHPDWHTAVANKKVWRFPLDIKMGVKGTTFECVTADKIHED